jgi:elongation factor P
MATYTAGDLRKGVKIEIDGQPFHIVDMEFVKPGKGQALYRCRLKNMITGTQVDRTYRSGDTFQSANLEERVMQYLYNDGHFFTFMDQKTYEQFNLTGEQIGDAKNYLTDNLQVDILLYNDRPIGVTLPNFVVLKVVRADPFARGDTATNVQKPVSVETGYDLQVPAFVEEGEKIQIDTRTGAYVTRVKG